MHETDVKNQIDEKLRIDMKSVLLEFKEMKVDDFSYHFREIEKEFTLLEDDVRVLVQEFNTNNMRLFSSFRVIKMTYIHVLKL